MRKMSVLNTDRFDRRRFQEIYQMSTGLKNLTQTGKESLPTYPELLQDIWGSLYKMNPQLKDKVAHTWLPNQALMKQIMSDDSFRRFREFTRLDDLSSALGTVKFGEKTCHWLNEQKSQNEKLRKHLEDARKQQDQLQKQVNTPSESADKKNGRKARKQTREKLRRALQRAAAEIKNHPEGLKKALTEAAQETQETKKELKSLLAGLNAGSGDAELKKVPLRDQIALAEKLSTDPKVKEIAKWAGRLKPIARKRQKSKKAESVERSGVTFGNDVERLLPMELGMYRSPATKLDFLKRFAENRTMQFEQRGRETLGKGPIVLCLDQSGSMTALDAQAKGFALALMAIARKQKRDFALILFSTITQTFQYKRGKITTKDMVKMATTFLDGGTSFNKPLSTALQVIEENRFKKADIVFVTDGRDLLDQDFIQWFQQKKKEKDFHVLTVLLKERNINSVEYFSDEIVQSEDLTNEGSQSAFAI